MTLFSYLLTGSRRIGLWNVHPEVKLIVTPQLPGTRDRRDILTRIVNNQCVCLRQQRCRARLIGLCIPLHTASACETGIVAQGIRSTVSRTRDQDIDVRRRDGKGGVVPAEGDCIPDFVVCRLRERGGCEHIDATWGETWVDISDLC